jgi:hypothetical protein
MNNSRWIMDCPRCSTPLPCRENGVVCPRCYPDMMARAWRQLANGDLRPVIDYELVNAALMDAQAKDEEYFPLYPKEREQIEQILRLRPARKHMNWIASESLDDLRIQNIEHGDAVPTEK